eukprot:TRINITY_DN497_c0_g1_i4.p1 TRINITY_DN497_c0_g1~~TRINITY_DN497_c0_g1_i4.p1  ORF type:complete len:183 (-),score=12.59 TRINITY_DN497_c0_g1_i4:98-646(-)
MCIRDRSTQSTGPFCLEREMSNPNSTTRVYKWRDANPPSLHFQFKNFVKKRGTVGKTGIAINSESWQYVLQTSQQTTALLERATLGNQLSSQEWETLLKNISNMEHTVKQLRNTTTIHTSVTHIHKSEYHSTPKGTKVPTIESSSTLPSKETSTQPEDHLKICGDCGTTSTPEWRRGTKNKM